MRYKLNDNSLKAFVSAFQKGLIEGKDISKMISNFEFIVTGDGDLECVNPPDPIDLNKLQEEGEFLEDFAEDG